MHSLSGCERLPPKVKRWFDRHPEYHLHFTPTSGSWLNQVERFFAEITEKRIRRGAFRSVAALEVAIMEYLANHNENPRPFVWTANADLILERVKKVCERISNSGHQSLMPQFRIPASETVVDIRLPNEDGRSGYRIL